MKIFSYDKQICSLLSIHAFFFLSIFWVSQETQRNCWNSKRLWGSSSKDALKEEIFYLKIHILLYEVVVSKIP